MGAGRGFEVTGERGAGAGGRGSAPAGWKRRTWGWGRKDSRQGKGFGDRGGDGRRWIRGQGAGH